MDGYVIAVCVHLNQLEVPAVEIFIQEIMVEFKHPQLCQLIHSSSKGQRFGAHGYQAAPDWSIWHCSHSILMTSQVTNQERLGYAPQTRCP